MYDEDPAAMTAQLFALPGDGGVGGEGGDGGEGGGEGDLTPQVEKRVKNPELTASFFMVRSHCPVVEWKVHCLHWSSAAQREQQSSALSAWLLL
jgi:hypothetical protein